MVATETIVGAFGHQCLFVWTLYQHYHGLFERGEQRVALLRQVAPSLFEDLNIVLVESIVLHVCRLTDPARSGGHVNLTTNALLEEYEWPSSLRARLEDLNSSMNKFRKDLVDARRKIIAHIDRDVLLSGTALGGFSPGAERRFFEDLQEFLDLAHGHCAGAPFPLLEAAIPGNADDLVRALAESVDYDDIFGVDWNAKQDRFSKARFRDA
jgi:hypothetical protein